MNIYDILDEIKQAYPEDVFPDTTQEERDEVIKRYPGFIDRTSAMMGRHLATVILQKLTPDDPNSPLKAIERLLANIYEFGQPTDDIFLDQAERSLTQIQHSLDRAGDLVSAARGLVEYRQRAGPLNFQLEKADYFLFRIRVALEAIGEASKPSDIGN